MKYIMTFLVLLLVYLFLAGFTLAELILGGLISAVLSMLIVKTVNYSMDITLPWKLLKFMVIYLPVFIYKLILANLDIAHRVLSVKIPLNPGIVKVKTKIKGDFGKLTLANSITLTPGTLSIDVDEDGIYVHAVDVKGTTAEEHQKNISGPFENILGGIFK
jgi:multicomponent Na+:H+ antiporter subunit E